MNAWTTWQLRKGEDRRFQRGHPWVYSNELQGSPKGLDPGAPVELRSASGTILARGYGNPHSLISFREMTRHPEADPFMKDALSEKLAQALVLREELGLTQASFRWVFAEADGLPGLIVDRYLLAQGQQVVVVQVHTAGMERILGDLIPLLQEQASRLAGGAACAVVIRKDLGVRKLEGLAEEKTETLAPISGVDLSQATIQVAGASGGGNVLFDVDLIEGQKTGFFLDQTANVKRSLELIGSKSKTFLDLCCYVGQWSTQFASGMKSRGETGEFTLVDVSGDALERAKRNVERAGGRVKVQKGDVLKDLSVLPSQSYDVVFCDPPALIRSRKDHGPGSHAYLQLNTQAIRLVRPGGWIVSCSCSGLLEEADFAATLQKAAARSKTSVKWVHRGGQAPDHPVLAGFPEGQYLKAWLGKLS